jgi:hypothetical protein
MLRLGLALLILTCCLGLARSASADTPPLTVKVKATYSGPEATMLPAGDNPGHLVGLGQRQGKAVFSDGRQAAYSNVFFLDLRRGVGADAMGYTRMVFPGGDWIFFKWESRAVDRDQHGPILEGQGTLLRGSGAYEGIKGTAKFSSRVLPPTPEHPKGQTEAEAELTYTLPDPD